MKKRRHHVVWRHYLRAWAEKDRLLCKQGDRVFLAGTANVAVETDFYRLMTMSEADRALIREVIARSPRESTASNLGWLSFFDDIVKLRCRYDAQPRKEPEVEAAFDEAYANLEEDLHSRIEASAIPHLDSLRNRKTGFLTESDGFSAFMFFLCVQQFRTRKLAASSDMQSHQIPDLQIAHAWPVLRFIFASNVASVYVRHRSEVRITLVTADADARLITGDQPVINIKALDLPDGKTPEYVTFYYPVSPRTAVVVSLEPNNPWPERLALSEPDVRKYNHAIARQASRQVFAQNSIDLPHVFVGESLPGNA